MLLKDMIPKPLKVKSNLIAAIHQKVQSLRSAVLNLFDNIVVEFG